MQHFSNSDKISVTDTSKASQPVGVGGGADVLLIFPPLTEARLFPYNSLPALHAFLKKHGYKSRQWDLNIALSHRLFSQDQLEHYLRFSTDVHGDRKRQYRNEYVRYLIAHRDEIDQLVYNTVPDENGSGQTAAIRLMRQGIALLTTDSFLSQLAPTFSSLDTLEYPSLHGPITADLATIALQQLVLREMPNPLPALVALSIPFFSQLVPAMLLSRWIKEISPDTRIAFGGPQIMLWWRELSQLRSFGKWVDYLGTGNGEATLQGLAEHILRGHRVDTIPDLVYQSVSQDINRLTGKQPTFLDLPTPDFEGLPIDRYMSGEVQLGLNTCVGCYWGRCAFCSYGNRSLRNRSYEQMTPERLADACGEIKQKYGVSRINFVDENTNLKLIIQAMRILNSNGAHITFSTRNRLEHSLTDIDFCRELADRGCVLMSCGYETNSQRLLNRLNKGVDAGQYQRIIDNLHEVGISLRFSILGGIPGETEDEFLDSLRFLELNQEKIGIDVIQMLVAEPQSTLHDRPEAFGIRLTLDAELRGNTLLNFGGGRMGHAFTYLDGPQFDARLERCLQIHDNVVPQKNDELRPARRAIPLCSPDVSDVVRLHPWVRIFQANKGERLLLADLVWQRFYQLDSEGVSAALDDSIWRVRFKSPHNDMGQPPGLLALLAADLGVLENTS
jgi:anaerobic magnesium-protoporphyrin IX monomethyl ester cyclase